MGELGWGQHSPVSVLYGNLAACSINKAVCFSLRTRYLAVLLRGTADRVQSRSIKVLFVPDELQKADCLAKNLDRLQHARAVQLISEGDA